MVKYIVLTLAFIFFFASRMEAQWQSIAPNLVGQGPYGNTGVMNASGGVAWAGRRDLFKSTDKGLTWQNVYIPKGLTDVIMQICFHDANNGLVSTEGGLYVTHDQGKTWNTYFPGDVIFSAIYSGSIDNFVVGNVANHSACFTRDGGKTWKNTVLSYAPKDFYSPKPGTVLAFVESTNSSYVAVTTDDGNTWVNQGGIMEPDAHTFGVVPCDSKIIFGINEEGGNYSQDNSFSEVYMSRDGGASFSVILSYPERTLSGCIAITPGVMYIPARSTGILESTDRGATWITATGPNLPIDSRDITTIDDTILLAADNVGTIWRKIDLRGASNSQNGLLSILPSTVLFPDSISHCAMPVHKSIYIARACGAPTITGISYLGNNDSNYFSISGKLSGDSMEISFFPDSARSYSSSLHLALNNGRFIDVPLQGFGKAPEKFSFSTVNILNDTIGATISIPIFSQSSFQYGNLDISIHFDTSMLIYEGTFRPGSTTDQTIARSIGFARLHFDQRNIQSSDSILGDARFQIFPTNTPCTTVLFDSINITNSNGAICALAPTSFSSEVCTDNNCGAISISSFMRYGKIPDVGVHPNPSTGSTSVRSDIDLGATRISVFDQMGRLKYKTESLLSPSHPAELHFNGLASGLYSIHVQGEQYSKLLQLIILH